MGTFRYHSYLILQFFLFSFTVALPTCARAVRVENGQCVIGRTYRRKERSATCERCVLCIGVYVEELQYSPMRRRADGMQTLRLKFINRRNVLGVIVIVIFQRCITMYAHDSGHYSARLVTPAQPLYGRLNPLRLVTNFLPGFTHCNNIMYPFADSNFTQYARTEYV